MVQIVRCFILFAVFLANCYSLPQQIGFWSSTLRPPFDPPNVGFNQPQQQLQLGFPSNPSGLISPGSGSPLPAAGVNPVVPVFNGQPVLGTGQNFGIGFGSSTFRPIFKREVENPTGKPDKIDSKESAEVHEIQKRDIFGDSAATAVPLPIAKGEPQPNPSHPPNPQFAENPGAQVPFITSV
uniref:Uncharacterized protein n=1 Tax=Panagrolaimus sp. JU765 TaxID=591449 RepID=A0AC34RIK4_9BILA